MCGSASDDPSQHDVPVLTDDEPDWDPYSQSNLTFGYLDLAMIRDGVALLTPEDPREIERQTNMLELLHREIRGIEPISNPDPEPVYCGCGFTLSCVDGEWLHDAAGWRWGGDHDPRPVNPEAECGD